MKLTSVTHRYYYPQILVLSNGNGNCTQVYFYIVKITEIRKPPTLEVMVGCCMSKYFSRLKLAKVALLVVNVINWTGHGYWTEWVTQSINMVISLAIYFDVFVLWLDGNDHQNECTGLFGVKIASREGARKTDFGFRSHESKLSVSRFRNSVLLQMYSNA